MKNIITVIFTISLVLNAQTSRQIKNQIKDKGISLDQAKQMVKDQGYSDSQIEAESGARGIDLDGAATEADIQQDKLGLDETNVILTDEDLSLKIVSATVTDTIGYFGYQIFSGDPSAFQTSTFGAIDPNYNIGPGDQIIVMLWGESQFRQVFTIDREGYVFIPEIGQAFVNGLNLEALEKKFMQILSKVYSTLKPSTGKPTTFMDISLGNLRPLRIIILGEVAQPGAYSVSPSTSLSSSLYYFRGPTTTGSLRDIRLLRKGKQIGSIDFYDYLLSGNTPNDLRLQLDDVVFIPPRGKTVTIYGEINREGIYELKETEGLKDLIQIAGNLQPTAYMKRAQISRIVPVDDRAELGMDRMVIDININAAIASNKDTELRNGDLLEIFSIEELQKNYVIVRGSSIMRPGKYELVPGMQVLDLINAADGLLNDAYLQVAHIIRKKDDLTTELISINLVNIFKGDLDENINLQFLDELIIYNNNILKNNFTNILLTGPVKNPGTFSLEADKNLRDLIIAAGGFNAGVKKVKITIARVNPNSFNPRIYFLPSKSSKNKYYSINQLDDTENEVNQFPLKPNDYVSIYADPKDQLPQTIEISGAVYFPGSYPIINKNEKVSNIIQRAGGLLPGAYPSASTFIRNNQTIQLSFEELISNSKSKENFFIMPGDQIIISYKSNTVQVLGEVNNPGIFNYYNNYNVRDYIALSGGLTTEAEKNEIWITYPDGTNEQLKRLSPSPRVSDGSIINIGKEKETEPLDKTEFAKEIASIIADFLQIALTLVIIANTSSG